ncbi:MAG: transketolase C-terminal domain-containing protein [Lachnospiraceae bacterium]|nr:transketolase C-terminal domain-containing protein [Lachnospiraceae bacterium]MDY4096687.1 transketolase C-terminal domain-containing protein [Lachnospiraceae bacterium]
MPWSIISKKDEFVDEYGNSEKNMRKLSYAEAIKEALIQALTLDSSVFLMGQGINDRAGMFGATTDIYKLFGEDRVFDTPLSETGLTGVAVGAAMAGYRPVYCHNRPDFLMLSMDQLVNHASKYNYMSGGNCPIPLVVWAVTGQGWGSAAQHSQALHGLFMHIPGLKIIMPTNPYDAKGLMLQAISDNNPVLFLDHRQVYNQIGNVPEEMYKIPFGKGVVRRKGTDVTIVGISSMLIEAIKAADELQALGISAEVIDLRTIIPYDINIIIESVEKTGYLIIADTGCKTAGAASEIAAEVYRHTFGKLKGPIELITLPDIPTPASYALEEVYYKTARDIVKKVKTIWESR